MKFADMTTEQQAAMLAYRANHSGKRTWSDQLVLDWLSDHRRQWGVLRGVRNQYPMNESIAATKAHIRALAKK